MLNQAQAIAAEGRFLRGAGKNGARSRLEIAVCSCSCLLGLAARLNTTFTTSVSCLRAAPGCRTRAASDVLDAFHCSLPWRAMATAACSNSCQTILGSQIYSLFCPATRWGHCSDQGWFTVVYQRLALFVRCCKDPMQMNGECGEMW
jgi:hypothetical protein